MTSAEIEAFLMVAKERNITAAAAKMFISQSSLSLRLKTLEKELGCNLFLRNRGKHEIRLTEQGEYFLELAIEYRRIVDKMSEIGKNAWRKLRIGSVNSITGFMLTEVCARFMQDHPEIDLEVHDLEKTSDICSWIEHGQLDLAFSGGSTYRRKVKTIPVFRERMLLVVNHVESQTVVISRADLDSRQEVYINWFTDFIQWHHGFMAHESGPSLFVSNMRQLEHFLRKPDRWAFVPASVAYGLYTSIPTLRHYETDFDIPERITNLNLPIGAVTHPLQDAFLDTLRTYAAESYGANITLL